MHQSLYHPQFGYYQQAKKRQDRHGDYITAPTLSPLFARCLSRSLTPLLTKHPWPLFEIGPGTGHLAVALLQALAHHNALPPAYHLIELSQSSQLQQQQYINQHLPENLAKLCHWHTHMPESFFGLVIANEVLDAMPIHLLETDDSGEMFSLVVTRDAGELALQRIQPDLTVLHAFQSRNIPIFPNYRYEVSLAIPNFIASVGASIQQGVLLLVDYGYPRHIFYHPQRCQGTLTCFTQHTTSTHCFLEPGQQDISCHVDFTLVAESGSACGLTVEGYTTQERFLIANGIQTELTAAQSHLSTTDFLRYQRSSHILTHPYEMGETMKVIALSKGLSSPANLMGFHLGCHTHQL